MSEEEKELDELEEEDVEETEDESEEETEEVDVTAELKTLKGEFATTQELLRQLLQQPQRVVEKEEAPIEMKLKEFDFTQGLDMDDVVSNPKLFNKILNQAAQYGAENALRQALKEAPDRVAPAVQKKVTETQMVESFFSKNSDLDALRPYFSTVMQQTYDANPTLPLAKLLETTATNVRQTLKMNVPTKRKKPGTVSPKGNSGFNNPKSKGEKLTPAQEMVNYLKQQNNSLR